MAKKQVDSRAVGLGGVFFRARNPARLSKWYQDHLGLKTRQNTALLSWRSPKNPKKAGYTVWALFPSNTKYFRNSRKQFMINYRVKNLDRVLAKLRREHVKVVNKLEDSEYGRFAWVSDPEGNWLELWEPPRKYLAPEEAMPME
jgi:predicted enzyme related to lactoylglutathione lyase